jgi:hypothetical protein
MTPTDWIRDRRHHDNARAAEIIEDAMAKKPTKALHGIPIGGSFEAIADKMGNMKVKPKRKKPGQTLNQAYASKHRKRYKGVAK